jgi:hypothetical protein
VIAVCELDETQWQPLRRGLEQTGLIQTESVLGVDPPFVRLHPTLAPALWAKLSAEEQARLTARYQEWYYQFSLFLYVEDSKERVATVRAPSPGGNCRTFLPQSTELSMPARLGPSTLPTT